MQSKEQNLDVTVSHGHMKKKKFMYWGRGSEVKSYVCAEVKGSQEYMYKNIYKLLHPYPNSYSEDLFSYIYNGIIFPSLNPAKNFQFISRWIESTKSSTVGPNHMRSNKYIKWN